MIELSIILVTRNAAPFIDGAIRMLRSHEDRSGTEIIAVDGGSTDGTWETLCGNEGWRVARQRGDGLAGARNQGLQLARGDIIAFADADDEWLPGKLDLQMAHLVKQPEADVVSCLLRKVGPGCDDTLFVAWTPPGCLFRRRAFDRVGRFDTRYRIACDHDWFLRARRANLLMVRLGACLLHKNVHSHNLSHDRAQYRRELLQALRSRA